MSETPLTPEEKLLRIIESPGAAARGMRPMRRMPDVKLSFKLFKAKHGEKLKNVLTLKTGNAALIVLAAAATLFLGADFWLGLPRQSVIDHLVLSGKNESIGDMVIQSLEPVSIYLQEITQRNIFSLPPPPSETAQTAASTEHQAQAVKSFIAGLRVVGIIWSDAPQAIIEDPQENKTYLLNRGGRLKDARVKEILKDKVILSYDNQDIELK